MQNFTFIWSFIVRYTEVIMLFLSLPLSLVCWYITRRQRAYVSEVIRLGIHTNGIVKARYVGRFHWYLAFSYKDRGNEYIQNQSVFRTVYNTIQEGAIVGVAYLPGSPQESVLIDIETWSFIHSLAIMLTVLNTLFIICVITVTFLFLILP